MEKLLHSGQTAPDDSIPHPSAVDVARIEAAIGFTFPESYRTFVELGGLAELRLRDRMLSPEGVASAIGSALVKDFVPFAANGCGDLVGWRVAEMVEPEVVGYDHEDKKLSICFSGFAEWLSCKPLLLQPNYSSRDFPSTPGE